jgi:hypothetical protein
VARNAPIKERLHSGVAVIALGGAVLQAISNAENIAGSNVFDFANADSWLQMAIEKPRIIAVGPILNDYGR